MRANQINSSSLISLKGNQVVLASLSTNITIVIHTENTLYEKNTTNNGIQTEMKLKTNRAI